MRVFVESTFDCPPESAWKELQAPRLLLEIIRPLVQFKAPRGTQFPERWRQGETVVAHGRVLGLVPLGRHRLHVERLDAEQRRIQSRESNSLVRRWDHLISVDEASDGRTRYSDEIEIQAGPLTPLVWLFAQWFYRHRQRKWRRVAQRLNKGR